MNNVNSILKMIKNIFFLFIRKSFPLEFLKYAPNLNKKVGESY